MPSRRSLRTLALDRTTRSILIVTFAGFVVRVAWAVVATRRPVGVHDPVYYLTYAERIAQGYGYTTPSGAATAYYPVGYPALLAIPIWIAQRLPGGHVLAAAVALNVVAGTATIAMVGALARRAVGPAAAVAAAAVVAFLPNLVFHTAVVLTETVFVAVLVAAVLVVCWAPWPASWSGRRVAAAGALVAVAALVRPVALVLVPVLVVAWVASVRPRRAAVVRSAVFVAVVLVVLAPWLARTWSVAGRLSLATSTGDNLCIGNNPSADGAFQLPDSCFGDITPEGFITGTDERDPKLTDKALDWARSNLAAEPALVLWRTYYTFQHDHDAIRAVESYGDDPWLQPRHAAALSTLSDGAYFAVLAAGLLGVVAVLRRGVDPRARFVVVVAAALVATVWPFFGEPRFHVPVLVLLAVPAGVVLRAAVGAVSR